ncbi:MAG: tetratricopeptide repeat protein [Phycisphaerae bacterium]|nr:tetratricopeptide repeat protein [Phycisphaerae bacterium]
MNQVLQVFGRGVSLDVADMVTQWIEKGHIANSERAMAPELRHCISCLIEKRFSDLDDPLRLYLFSHSRCVTGHMINAAHCLYQGDVTQALDAFKEVYQLQPANTLAAYGLGHCHERLSQHEDAAQYYQDCLKYSHHLELPLQRLAAIYARQGRFESSLEQYTLLQRLLPDDLATQNTLGYLSIAACHYQEAEETFNTAVLMLPDSSSFADPTLQQMIAEQEYTEAVDYLDEKLDDTPDMPELWSKKGDVLARLGATTEAMAAYKQALQGSPICLDAAVKLGTLYARCDQFLPAMDMYLRAIEINEQLLDSYLGIAAARKMKNDVSGAMQSLQSATLIWPNSTMLFSEVAKLMATVVFSEHCNNGILDLQPNTGMVFDALNCQIASQPNNPISYYHRGMLEVQTQGLDKALESFQRATRLNESYWRAQAKSVLCLFCMGHTQDALRTLTAGVHPDEQTLKLNYETAVLYWNHVKFAGAMMNLFRVQTQQNRSDDCAQVISTVLESIGVIDHVDIMWDSLQETLLGVQRPRP